MTRAFSDPSDIDAAPDVEREDEDLRTRRWNEFVSIVGQWARDMGWGAVLADLERGYVAMQSSLNESYGPGRFAWHAIQFAESEGWPDTICAIARAMDEADDVNRTDPRR